MEKGIDGKEIADEKELSRYQLSDPVPDMEDRTRINEDEEQGSIADTSCAGAAGTQEVRNDGNPIR